MNSSEKATDTSDGSYAITLPGPGLGDVAVGDVVEFLRGVVDLVAHGAAAEIAKPIGSPGRRGAAVEGASRVRLVGLKNGSLVAEFAPALPTPAPDSMNFDAAALSELGLQAVFDAVEGRERRPELGPALIEFARRMGARRPGQPVVFIDRRQSPETATALDDSVVRRLEALQTEPARPGHRDQGLTGRIFEANVDTDEARLRTPAGETVKVDYEPDLEGDIKSLLGDRASLRGEVIYDPVTNRVRSIHATDVFAGDQLEFEGVDFWREPTLTELAETIEAQPVRDPDELHFDATDSEWDELYAVLRDAR